MTTLRIDLDYLAKTYGLTGRVMFRVLEDPETFRATKLEMVELPADVARDLDAIRAIGTDPDPIEFHEALMEAYE